jgi:hypothetical protein
MPAIHIYLVEVDTAGLIFLGLFTYESAKARRKNLLRECKNEEIKRINAFIDLSKTPNTHRGLLQQQIS